MPLKKEADMELYAAIDLHSNNSVLVVTDLEDHVVFAKRLRNDLELIVSALRGCPGAIRAVAVESTYYARSKIIQVLLRALFQKPLIITALAII
jgi:hypothetical protein